ncbi:uncharacterized protein PSFLO_06342 [Pseudozyma flocculosa]|uniref:Uncharacterized protein n=1 Tax=Pseudozyma flocculosa TaxID=84751 RepID=A0A5C3F9H4_9BASI|nr:uncharacterized protein PSFLO_06342 [Pseudozyma flocculosa]
MATRSPATTPGPGFRMLPSRGKARAVTPPEQLSAVLPSNLVSRIFDELFRDTVCGCNAPAAFSLVPDSLMDGPYLTEGAWVWLAIHWRNEFVPLRRLCSQWKSILEHRTEWFYIVQLYTGIEVVPAQVGISPFEFAQDVLQRGCSLCQITDASRSLAREELMRWYFTGLGSVLVCEQHFYVLHKQSWQQATGEAADEESSDETEGTAQAAEDEGEDDEVEVEVEVEVEEDDEDHEEEEEEEEDEGEQEEGEVEEGEEAQIEAEGDHCGSDSVDSGAGGKSASLSGSNEAATEASDPAEEECTCSICVRGKRKRDDSDEEHRSPRAGAEADDASVNQAARAAYVQAQLRKQSFLLRKIRSQKQGDDSEQTSERLTRLEEQTERGSLFSPKLMGWLEELAIGELKRRRK